MARLSIFPLGGALLFPRALLPLHIFEPRYRAMMSDAMARDRRIGMIQPRDGDHKKPALFDIGCVGRIAEFEALDDGRYNLVLEGLTRFRLVRELDVTTAFRQVEADWSGFEGDGAEPRSARPGTPRRSRARGAALCRSQGLCDRLDGGRATRRRGAGQRRGAGRPVRCRDQAGAARGARHRRARRSGGPVPALLPPRRKRRGRRRHAAMTPAGVRPAGVTIDPALLAILVCPMTRTPLRLDAERGELVSDEAGLAYPIRDGVPVLLIEAARRVDDGKD